jgi:ABC-type uncharacterized transport system permease subunit
MSAAGGSCCFRRIADVTVLSLLMTVVHMYLQPLCSEPAYPSAEVSCWWELLLLLAHLLSFLLKVLHQKPITTQRANGLLRYQILILICLPFSMHLQRACVRVGRGQLLVGAAAAACTSSVILNKTFAPKVYHLAESQCSFEVPNPYLPSPMHLQRACVCVG